MATCPNCGASSRTDPTFTVTEVFEANPIGTFSVAGAQMKVTARSTLRLQHARCGWYIHGRIEDGEFLGDPATQVFPPCGEGCGGCDSCC